MSGITINKVVTKKHEEAIHIEWVISVIFSAPKRTWIYSPNFSFANNSWHISILPESVEYVGFIRLELKSSQKQDYPLEYDIGLKKVDGSVVQVITGILEAGVEKYKSTDNFIKFSELLEKKSELVPSNILTVICTLKRDTGLSTAMEDKPKLKKIIGDLDKLSKNFKDIFADKESCDIILKVKDKEFKAHRIVLMARSSVFLAMFKHDTSEKQTGVINIPDCDPDCFGEFLEYLYCGQLEDISFRSAYHLYGTSDKYEVQELKISCIEFMIENLTVENLCDVAILAHKYDEEKLISAVQTFFNGNFKEIWKTPEWECLLKNDHRLGNKLLIEMSKMY